MTNLSLRLATVADARIIAAIDHAGAAPQDAHRAELVRELLKLNMSWIAEAGGAAAGYAIVSRRFFSRRFVEMLAVDPAFRRLGVGAALMAQCEAAQSQGFGGAVLFASTNQSNAAMQALLAKAGYEASGVIYNLDPGDPELVYVKFRSPA